jgi:hypothetical protein
MRTTIRERCQRCGCRVRYSSGARTAVTPDGRFVGFMSSADNLVPDDTNLSADVFVRDGLT